MTLTMTLLLVKNRQPFQYSNYYTFWWACQSGGGSIYNQHFTMWTWDVFSVWSFRWGYIVWYLISISTQRAVKVQVAGNFLRGVHSNSLLLALRLIFLLAPLGVFADLMTPWFFPPPPTPHHHLHLTTLHVNIYWENFHIKKDSRCLSYRYLLGVEKVFFIPLGVQLEYVPSESFCGAF